MKKLNVLIACEFSGAIRNEFRKLGHNAFSCDIVKSEDNSPHHFICDVRNTINAYEWDLMIAHPPCTYLTNSGVCHLHKDETRWEKLDEGAKFFKQLLNANIPMICVENPIMHKYAKERIGNIKQSQIIQPWMFGHTEQKATCLWLKGLPLLIETNNVKEEKIGRAHV